MDPYQIVVLDIGKTNKKLFVYDARLRCLNAEEKGQVFPEIEKDGIRCDDMASIYRWMIDGLRLAARRYSDIRCISISTHGATLALLGAVRDEQFNGDGGLAFPIVSYTNDIGAQADAAFYCDMRMTPEEMQRRTGTARFGRLVNHAKQIWWLKRERPREFARVTDILMYPQYFAYLLTGRKAIDPTSLGCHGYLLDAKGENYSLVAKRLGILDKLPPLPCRHPWVALGALMAEIVRATGLRADCVVTAGVHDSNAALVPYFVKGLRPPSLKLWRAAQRKPGTTPLAARRSLGEVGRDFAVQDSGTWIVTMSPARRAVFAKGELGKEIFFNRSIYGEPVKTTIFRGGAEFDFYAKNVLRGLPHPKELDVTVLRRIVNERRTFCLPTVERGTGLFPESAARIEGVDDIFRDAPTAWCVVDLGLAIQGYYALKLAAGPRVKRIYIEGNVGRSNPVYRSVISTLFPHARVFFGNTGGAPYGAAILGATAVEGKRPEQLAARVRMHLREVPKLTQDVSNLREYVRMFLSRAGAKELG